MKQYVVQERRAQKEGFMVFVVAVKLQPRSWLLQRSLFTTMVIGIRELALKV